MPEAMQKVHNDDGSACEQIVAALTHNTNWLPLKEALQFGRGYVPWIMMDRKSEIAMIACREGEGARDPFGNHLSISFQATLENVINPLIRTGMIQDGSIPGCFDDRKVRWSDQSVKTILLEDSNTLSLRVAPTFYPHCQIDIHRKPSEALQLMLAGIQAYQDPYAFFARGMGVVAIPLSRNGHVFIGQRTHTSEYKNFLSFISGWAEFSANVGNIDFYRDVQRELKEELLLSSTIKREHLRFVGLAGHPLTGEADLIFLAQTGFDDEFFYTGPWPEHAGWYAIRSRSEAQRLLEEGRLKERDEEFSLMFSSRAGLDFLINNYWST